MKKIILLTFVLLLTSCNLFRVYDQGSKKGDTSGKIRGIPFFSHEIIQVDTETYQEKFYEIRLQTTLGKKNADADEAKKSDIVETKIKYSNEICAITFNNKFVNTRGLSKKAALIDNPKINKCNFLDEPFKVRTRSQLGASTSKSENELSMIQIAHTRTNRVQPGKEKYYINVRRAASGTTDGTITLNDNGTLASAEASVEDELLGNIVEALPIGDIVSSVFGLSEDAITADALTDESADNKDEKNDDEIVFKKVEITLVPITRTYQEITETNLNNNEKFEEGLRVTETRGSSNNSNRQANQNANRRTISLSGTVVLPNEEDDNDD